VYLRLETRDIGRARGKTKPKPDLLETKQAAGLLTPIPARGKKGWRQGA